MLGLKKSLHKSDRNAPDLSEGNIISRESYEIRFGLTRDESKKSTESILAQIDQSYKIHQKNIKADMKAGILKLSDDYFAGLVDGDAGFYVTVSYREPTANCSKRLIEWQGNLSFTMDINSLQVVEVFLYAIGSSARIIGSPNTGATSVNVLVRKQEDVSRILSILERFPLIGDYKSKELETVVELRRLKTSGLIKNYEAVCIFLELIYYVTDISRSGRQRNLTLSEAKKKAFDWLLS
jgi:hypothetical protein